MRLACMHLQSPRGSFGYFDSTKSELADEGSFLSRAAGLGEIVAPRGCRCGGGRGARCTLIRPETNGKLGFGVHFTLGRIDPVDGGRVDGDDVREVTAPRALFSPGVTFTIGSSLLFEAWRRRRSIHTNSSIGRRAPKPGATVVKRIALLLLPLSILPAESPGEEEPFDVSSLGGRSIGGIPCISL